MDTPLFRDPARRDEQLDLLEHELGHYICAKILGRRAYILIDDLTPKYSVFHSTDKYLFDEGMICAAGIEAERICDVKYEMEDFQEVFEDDLKDLAGVLKAMNLPRKETGMAATEILDKCERMLKYAGGREFLEDRAQKMLEEMGEGSIHFFVSDDDYEFMTEGEYLNYPKKDVHILSPVDFPFMLTTTQYVDWR